MADEHYDSQKENFENKANMPGEGLPPRLDSYNPNLNNRYPPPAGNANQGDYRFHYDEYRQSERARRSGGNGGVAIFGVFLALVLAIGMVGLSTYGVYTYLTRSESNSATPQVPQAAIEESAEGRSQVPSLAIQDRPVTPSAAPSAAPENTGRLTTVEIARKVSPSVVGITQYSGYNMFEPSGQGSGIVMDTEGYILTNAHVVQDAVGINVELTDGESYPAQLIGVDTKTDLAVIKIEAEGLVAAEFGNSDELEVGEKVVAIGNPAGSILAGSVTQGIISGKNRALNDGGYSSTFLQVDAAINPGNSGGALVNEYGQVVGINSAKIADINFEGIGFAIPSNEAKPIVDELIQFGYVRGRTKLGITGTEINEALANINELPVGIYIWTIEATSDLAGKNVAKGDIITHIDGNRIEKFDDLTSILKSKKPGDTLRLTIYRSTQRGTGKSFDVTVELMEDIDENIRRNSR
jgi:serine protease Do